MSGNTYYLNQMINPNYNLPLDICLILDSLEKRNELSRKVVELYVFEKRSISYVCRKLNISRKVASRHLQIGLSFIRRVLIKEGGYSGKNKKRSGLS